MYTKKPIKSGKYYFCGSPSGGTSTSYWCFVYDNTTGSGAKKWDGTSGISRDYGDVHKNEVLIDDTHSQRFTILIANGYTASNVVFRPMIWSGDISDDTFEPYQEPTDSLIETKARAYLTSSLGHVSKNVLDLHTYRNIPAGITLSTCDNETGTIIANATGAWKAISWEDNRFIQDSTKRYIVSGTNNIANSLGRISINNRTDQLAYTKVNLSSTGSFSFEIVPSDYPDGFWLQVYMTSTSSTTATGSVNISNFMIREAVIEDDTFDPYRIPTDEAKRDKPVVLYDAGESSVGLHSVTGLSNLTQYSELHITLFAPSNGDDPDGGFTHTIVHPFIFPNIPNSQVTCFDCRVAVAESGTVKYKQRGMAALITNTYVSITEFDENANLIIIPSNHYIYIKRIVGIP